ncbi:Phosphopantetheine attachment site [Streptomyces melanosporofaciens]|uniref:Phosphopantetheine attachment site n=2 Tax=Streptomyces melanosporofaciens TaxID=67327 RepID=A0A1H4YNA5_STRMJ|nr:Phosphopantetheine attachment site [Streptomyces melanosporofaciens]
MPPLAVQPSSATERRLALIWSRILAVQPQGQDADFFALGGDSLAVPRVRDAVLASFGVDVPLNSFYECPQLRQLATRVGIRTTDTIHRPWARRERGRPGHSTPFGASG